MKKTKTLVKDFSIVLVLGIVVFGLSLSLQSIIAAWTAPSGNPPTSNTNPPIFNDSALNTVKAQINAGSGQEALRLKSDANYSPLNIQSSAGADMFRVNQKGDIAVSPTISKDPSGNVIIKLGN
jgi:hypothetical protein